MSFSLSLQGGGGDGLEGWRFKAQTCHRHPFNNTMKGYYLLSYFSSQDVHCLRFVSALFFLFLFSQYGENDQLMNVYDVR